MFDYLIIGGGIVGNSVAMQLKNLNPKLKVALVEKESSLSKHQTGNNSGVIHSGIYYKPGSLKATNCINGYNQLLTFCNQNDINYEICGKLIVATNSNQFSALDSIFKRGNENGLSNLKILGKEQLQEKEPHCSGLKALHVPSTGIVNYTEITKKMSNIFLNKGGEIFLNSKVKKINKSSNSFIVETNYRSFKSKRIINCAGLYSDKITKLTSPKEDITIIPFRGEYYDLVKEKRYLVKNLIYPVPDPNFPFLGVHFTRTINGKIEAGPNAVLAFAREGYKNTNINLKELSEIITHKGFLKIAAKHWKNGLSELYRSFSKSAFTNELRKLVPEINENDLVTGGSGVRAQACNKKGELLDDFKLVFKNDILHVCNAPSPAATSCLSIGKTIINNFN